MVSLGGQYIHDMFELNVSKSRGEASVKESFQKNNTANAEAILKISSGWHFMIKHFFKFITLSLPKENYSSI